MTATRNHRQAVKRSNATALELSRLREGGAPPDEVSAARDAARIAYAIESRLFRDRYPRRGNAAT